MQLQASDLSFSTCMCLHKFADIGMPIGICRGVTTDTNCIASSHKILMIVSSMNNFKNQRGMLIISLDILKFILIYLNRIRGAEYSVIHQSNDLVEVSFRSTYNPSTRGMTLPLSVDTRLSVYFLLAFDLILLMISMFRSFLLHICFIF